jgi:2-methylisocitrate lyase-like PEP mutase family enzyme
MTASQEGKGRAFQALHKRPGCFVIPNPWDIGTTRLLSQLGFEALATTSAGLAFSLGRRDGQGALLRDEVLANARDIVAATDLPVSADLENCFDDRPEGVAETIKLAAEVGLVGGSIEDATGNPSRPIYDFDLAVDRVRAGVDSARRLAFPFLLTARAENFLYGRPNLADTIRRLQAFQEVGADVLYAPGLRSRADISTVVRSIDRPLNVVMGLKGVTLSVSELAAIGVKRVSLGSTLSRVALGAFLRAVRELRKDGSFSFAEDAIPFDELNDMFQVHPPKPERLGG